MALAHKLSKGNQSWKKFNGGRDGRWSIATTMV